MLKFLGILVRKFNWCFFFFFLELFLDLCHNGYGSAVLMPGPVLQIRIRMEPELFRIRIRTYIFGSGSGNFIWMYQHMEVRINKRKREEKKNYAPVDLRLYIPQSNSIIRKLWDSGLLIGFSLNFFNFYRIIIANTPDPHRSKTFTGSGDFFLRKENYSRVRIRKKPFWIWIHSTVRS